MVAPDPLTDPSSPNFSYETSPHLFLFTSLTAGSSHIITATSRLETILKANRIAFRAIDCATDEKARRIWSRRAGKRKLPGLVREGTVLADLETVEDWNEYGELKQQLNAPTAPPTASSSPAPPPDAHKENAPPSGAKFATLPIREQPPQQQSEHQPPNRSSYIVTRVGPDAVAPSDDQASAQHSTSPSAGLPPLSFPIPAPNKPRVGFATDSPTYPEAPPPTAQSRLADEPPSAGETALPLHPPSLPAGPAAKSGLEAVFSDPKAAEAVAAGKIGGTRVTFSEDQLKGDARDGRAAEDSVGD